MVVFFFGSHLLANPSLSPNPKTVNVSQQVQLEPGIRFALCMEGSITTGPSGTGAKFHHPRDSGNWFEMDLKLEILKRWRQNAASS